MTSVLESLNAALKRSLAADPDVILLGEDVLDPYGGAFKVTRGLSQAFPEQVLPTPISEAGFVGAGLGMALRGLRPVVEIMFGDFITLAADQLINHAAKFGWMFSGGQEPASDDSPAVQAPLLVRTPMGGRRGYGPTHSQTLEKHFLGAPGLRVLAPAAMGDPGALLKDAILHGAQPTLFIENKLLYLLPILTPDDPDLAVETIAPRPAGAPAAEHSYIRATPPTPIYRVTVRGAPPATLTLAAYGYAAELARQALLRLAYEREIFAELIVPTQLAPFALGPLLQSARRTGRLVTVEEGSLDLGWGAEVLAQAAEALTGQLRAVRRIAAANQPVPSSPALEQAALPQIEDITIICTEISQNG